MWTLRSYLRRVCATDQDDGWCTLQSRCIPAGYLKDLHQKNGWMGIKLKYLW
jgi:hypothetical protein